MARKSTVEQELVNPTVSGEAFEPYVAATDRVPEFTLKAVCLGSVITLLFGAANAYLGLKAGLTVASSIPASIIAAVFFKFIRRGTPLENNIIQTIGSTGYSLASAIVLIIPAFFLWNMDPGQFRIFLIALIGGVLGVLMIIPLRYYLMVKEHNTLPFPEGVACAEVIISSQEAATKGRFLFYGLGIGFLYNVLAHPHFLGLWEASPGFAVPGYTKAQLSAEATPELLGAGFIIGPRISAIILAGGLFGVLVLVPVIAIVAQGDTAIAAMSAGAIRSKYVRLIGAGALMASGLFGLVRALPVIVGSIKATMRGFGVRAEGAKALPRTQQDLPTSVVVVGALALTVLLALLPQSTLSVGWLGAGCVLVFGFIFSAVLSRAVGLIGSSAAPLSSMVIATLILTTALFTAFGLTADTTAAKITILTIGSLVCMAVALSQDISQDLKTGFLIGATPAKAQIAQLLSIVVSAPLMASIVYLFKDDVLSGALAAPQANLMATMVDGMLGGNLPWGLLVAGGILALVLELVGISTLAFAIGLYLPFGITVPIGLGGALSALLRRRSGADKGLNDQRQERGVLVGSGYIAGGAIAGVLITVFVAAAERWEEPHAVLTWIVDVSGINPGGYEPTWEPFVSGFGPFGSLVIFALLAWGLYRFARGKKR